MVVAGRVLPDGDVAIMMVEAEATEKTIQLIAGGATAPTEEVVAQGLEAAKPFIKALCEAQSRAGREGRQAGRRVPALPRLPGRRLRRRRGPRRRQARPGAADRRQARARGRHRRAQGRGQGRAGRPVRGPREGDLRCLPRADQEGRPPAHPARQGPHRRPRPHRHPAAVGRGRGHPARARLGAVRARRDPDPGRHHAEHAPHGAAAGHAVAGHPQALHAQLQLPAVLHR